MMTSSLVMFSEEMTKATSSVRWWCHNESSQVTMTSSSFSAKRKRNLEKKSLMTSSQKMFSFSFFRFLRKVFSFWSNWIFPITTSKTFLKVRKHSKKKKISSKTWKPIYFSFFGNVFSLRSYFPFFGIISHFFEKWLSLFPYLELLTIFRILSSLYASESFLIGKFPFGNFAAFGTVIQFDRFGNRLQSTHFDSRTVKKNF